MKRVELKSGYVEIHQDDNTDNPRTWDNLGTITYKHRNYKLGEETIGDPIEWLEDMLGLKNQYTYTNQRLQELETLFYKKFIALPIYLYDHSGISIQTTPFSCTWDSGKVGYIYITKKKIREEYSTKIVTAKLRERVQEYLKGEITTFNQYLTGDVYGFKHFDAEGEEIDACWGFYGDNAENGIFDHLDIEETFEEYKAAYEAGKRLKKKVIIN